MRRGSDLSRSLDSVTRAAGHFAGVVPSSVPRRRVGADVSGWFSGTRAASSDVGGQPMAARKVLIRFPVLALGVGFMASVARGLVVLLGGLVLAVVRPPVAHAATFTVDSTVDAVDAAPGDGVCATAGGTCTLRAAVQEANALGGANTIEVPAGTHTLTLAGVEDAAASGDLDVTGGSLTIEGAAAATTVVDANGLDRIFEVLAPATSSIANLTMKNRRSPATISYPITGSGGGIFNHGTLTLTNSGVTGNSAVAGQLGIGGGIENDG